MPGSTRGLGKEKQDIPEGTLLAYLRRRSTRKGIIGDSRPWLYIAAATWVIRLLRRTAFRKPEILVLEELKPGERIIISNSRPTVDSG
jgi:hypothetical protein